MIVLLWRTAADVVNAFASSAAVIALFIGCRCARSSAATTDGPAQQPTPS